MPPPENRIMIVCSICDDSYWCDGGDTCDCGCHDADWDDDDFEDDLDGDEDEESEED